MRRHADGRGAGTDPRNEDRGEARAGDRTPEARPEIGHDGQRSVAEPPFLA